MRAIQRLAIMLLLGLFTACTAPTPSPAASHDPGTLRVMAWHIPRGTSEQEVAQAIHSYGPDLILLQACR